MQKYPLTYSAIVIVIVAIGLIVLARKQHSAMVLTFVSSSPVGTNSPTVSQEPVTPIAETPSSPPGCGLVNEANYGPKAFLKIPARSNIGSENLKDYDEAIMIITQSGDKRVHGSAAGESDDTHYDYFQQPERIKDIWQYDQATCTLEEFGMKYIHTP